MSLRWRKQCQHFWSSSSENVLDLLQKKHLLLGLSGTLQHRIGTEAFHLQPSCCIPTGICWSPAISHGMSWSNSAMLPLSSRNRTNDKNHFPVPRHAIHRIRSRDFGHCTNITMIFFRSSQADTTGVGIDVPFWGLVSHHLPISVGD